MYGKSNRKNLRMPNLIRHSHCGDRGEAPPVNRRCSQLSQRQKMLRGAITFMLGKSIPWVDGFVTLHDAVARDLGDNRGCADHGYGLIAVRNCPHCHGHRRSMQTVYPHGVRATLPALPLHAALPIKWRDVC